MGAGGYCWSWSQLEDSPCPHPYACTMPFAVNTCSANKQPRPQGDTTRGSSCNPCTCAWSCRYLPVPETCSRRWSTNMRCAAAGSCNRLNVILVASFRKPRLWRRSSGQQQQRRWQQREGLMSTLPCLGRLGVQHAGLLLATHTLCDGTPLNAAHVSPTPVLGS
jgi:hypothetical protein